ncbi:TadG family pilus assembly protein [Caballeronia sp. LZ032]|uniref:TadG family pilus assembly protein n=1 Tax=Caballeronia sp. LZ032 TaxID=3038565 RepID=UPI0028615BB4|nr:TadG family pilus assembly protein [Caballeronia sp. LZ032]MDR5881302.1 TadG family pilus assembly protein [Caballeronia sp. LZ032]
MKAHRTFRPHLERQRGAAATLAAIWLIVAVAALGALDIGNLFFARRALQSVVDLAASAGTQSLSSSCARATSAATGSALVNGFDANAAGNSLSVTCGRWDAQANAAPDHFSTSGTPVNAVKVSAARMVPYFFVRPSRQVTATAIARATDIGSFSIGTTLVSLGAGQLNSLLNALLGTSLNLNLVSYQGLANAQVRVGDLVTAAGVGTVDQLLGLQLSAGDIAKLMLKALQTTSVVNTNLSTAIGAMGAIVNANIPGNQTIALGSKNGSPGLLSIALANTQSALDATINPLEALLVSAEIAQAGKAAVILKPSIDLGLLGSVTLSVQIIEPPALAIGEAGQDGNGNWRTQASTAQVRAVLDVSLVKLPNIPLIPLLSGQMIHLPLYVDAASGTAWLASTQCAGPPLTRRSVIGVQGGIANVCVGDLTANAAFGACSVPATILNVPGVASVSLAAALPATMPASAAPNITFDGVSGNADDYQTVPSAPGASLANGLSGLNKSLSGTLKISSPILPTVLTDLLSGIVTGLLGGVVATLPQLLTGLDTVLLPVLQALGVQVGASTIHDLSLTCGESQLAY